MPKATVLPGYRITIPREVREALELKPGDKLIVRVEGKIVVLTKKPAEAVNHPRC
jgi:AbrB family looped-hinge helix DNA binding protein